MSLPCPRCHGKTAVKDSRVHDVPGHPEAIRRRLQCKACGETFTTLEMLAVRDNGVLKLSVVVALTGTLRKLQKRLAAFAEIEKQFDL